MAIDAPSTVSPRRQPARSDRKGEERDLGEEVAEVGKTDAGSYLATYFCQRHLLSTRKTYTNTSKASAEAKYIISSQNLFLYRECI